jgi:hypothetical protein
MTVEVRMRPEELLAREDIRYTMAVYNTAGDRGRFEELASTFMEDGVLDGRDGPVRGRSAIAKSLVAARKVRLASPGRKITFSRHNLTTSRIEFTSQTEADGWTYFLMVTDFGLDHAGTYVDKLRKCGDRWLFAHRRVKIHWDSPESTYHKDEAGGLRKDSGRP